MDPLFNLTKDLGWYVWVGIFELKGRASRVESQDIQIEDSVLEPIYTSRLGMRDSLLRPRWVLQYRGLPQWQSRSNPKH